MAKKKDLKEIREQIIQFAMTGKDRPFQKYCDPSLRVLGKLIAAHIVPCGKHYDPEFVKEIQKIAPHWFYNKEEQRKRKLLILAENGAKKPDSESANREESFLGELLYALTSKHLTSFDETFANKISAIRPEWVVQRISTLEESKKHLLDIAKSGGQRPSQASRDKKEKKLGIQLAFMTCQSSWGFELDFTNEIKSVRPDWFTRDPQSKKQKLIELAKSGFKKPQFRNTDKELKNLANTLYVFTCVSSHRYDAEFDQEIRALRPDWFQNVRKTGIKEELLKIAKNGKIKPSINSKKFTERALARRLLKYVKRDSPKFDASFVEKIKSLRPDWLK